MQLLKLGIPAWLILTLGSCLPAMTGGCASGGPDTRTAQEKHADDVKKMQVLQQGKARGHLVIASGGKLGVGARNDFYLGAMDTNFSFTGEVDFTNADFPKIEKPVGDKFEIVNGTWQPVPDKPTP